MSPSYVVQQDSGWCFRIRIPADLQGLLGRKEIRYGLRTGSRREAKYRARRIAGEVQFIFRRLRILNGRKEAMAEEGIKLNDSQIKGLIDKLIQRILEEEEEDLLMRPPLRDGYDAYDEWVEGLDEQESQLLEAYHLRNYEVVDSSARELLEGELDLKPEALNPLSYRRLQWEVLRGWIKATKMIIAWRRNPLSEFPRYQPQAIPEPPPQTPSAETQGGDTRLSNVIEAYWKENDNAGSWAERTKVEYRRTLDLLLEAVGDLPLSDITYETVRGFKDTLLGLPKRMNSPRFSGKSIPEILELAKGEEKRSVSTVNKDLSVVTSLFNWAIRNHYMEGENPAKGLQISNKKTKKRKSEMRDPFTQEDLTKIFQSKGYAEDSFRRSYQFWLPLLGLYTGARIEELCQLHVADLVEAEPGLWVLDINDKDGKRLKTPDSARQIPLHPVLVETLDFPAFVKRRKKAGHKRIFHELKKINHRYSHSATKWFGEYRKKCGITGSKKTFHSFRHTFIDHLKKQDVNVSQIKQLAGHSDGDITTGLYGKAFSASQLYQEAILKIDFGVDLGRVSRSKFIGG